MKDFGCVASDYDGIPEDGSAIAMIISGGVLSDGFSTCTNALKISTALGYQTNTSSGMCTNTAFS